jgi:E3 ubiquitin-protein ligase BOI-like protein
MAVQAPQHLLSHASFLPHHDLSQYAFRAMEGAALGGVFLDELGIAGCVPAAVGIGDTVFGGAAHSELTCNGGGDYDDALLPRKRARVASGILECGGQLQGGLFLPQAAAVPQHQVFPGDVQSRSVACGAASTSGRAPANGVLAHLYHQGVEIDAVVRLEVQASCVDQFRRLFGVWDSERPLLIRRGHGF